VEWATGLKRWCKACFTVHRHHFKSIVALPLMQAFLSTKANRDEWTNYMVAYWTCKQEADRVHKNSLLSRVQVLKYANELQRTPNGSQQMCVIPLQEFLMNTDGMRELQTDRLISMQVDGNTCIGVMVPSDDAMISTNGQAIPWPSKSGLEDPRQAPMHWT